MDRQREVLKLAGIQSRGKIYKSEAELAGSTPLLEVTNLEKELGLSARILDKLEN